MKLTKLLFVFLSMIATPTFAATLQSEVYWIDFGQKSTDEKLIYLKTDGQVGFLAGDQTKALTLFMKAIVTHQNFEFTLNEQFQITKVVEVAPLGDPSSTDVPPHPPVTLMPFTPTVLPDDASANQIFHELNRNYRGNSQCYNRAHIWTYEEFKKRDLYAQKVFLFFTSKYIRDYHYRWWFHVSPFVLVNENGATVEQVTDPVFLKAPTNMHQWTNQFIEPKTECPTVAKYSDYYNHQQESYCYLIKVSQYYWQPRDIDNFERTGIEKTDFLQSEVDFAYRQGFGGKE